MNFDGAGTMDSVNLKLDTILSLLGDNKTTDSSFLKKVKETFTRTDKQEVDEQSMFKRLKQKQKRYQSIPITIDGLTMDGKKDLVKNLKGIFSFPEIKGVKDLVKSDFFKDLLLIAGLLTAAYLAFKGKIDEFTEALRQWSIVDQLAKAFSSIFSSNPKQVEEAQAILKENVQKYLKQILDPKTAEELRAAEVTPAFKALTKRFYAIPEEYLRMTVAELEGEIKYQKERARYAEAYQDWINTERLQLAEDLEKLKQAKQKGATTEELTRLQQAIITANEGALDAKKSTPFLKNIGLGLKQFGKNTVTFVTDFIRLLPLGNYFLQVGEFIKKHFTPIAVVLTTVEAGIHLWQGREEKDKKKRSQDIVITLTAWAANIIGLVGGLLVAPLAFIRREDIEQNIKKIFTSDSATEMIERILSLPLELLIKGTGEMGHFLLNIPLYGAKLFRKINTWLFGAEDKKGWFELYLEELMANLRKEMEDFNLVDIGYKLGERLYDLFTGDIFTLENLKKIIPAVLSMLPGINTVKSVYDAGKALYQGKQKYARGTLNSTTELNDGIVSQGKVIKIDDNDQVLALKPGGPIEKALISVSERSTKEMQMLAKTVQRLTEKLETHLNETKMFYNTELKTINTSNALLQQIRDKEQKSSNVVVQNNANSTVFADRGATNLMYRRNLANRV